MSNALKWVWVAAPLSVALVAAGACSGDADVETSNGAGGGDACPTGLTDCDGACVQTDLDPANCGTCGNACPEGELCSTGQCATECLGGTTQCDGLCVDINLDPDNCGSCNNVCASDEVCSVAQCALQCAGGTTNCGGLCIDTNLDPANCGSCDNACAEGEVCSAGQCALQCAGGTTECSGVCVDFNIDPANCGWCDNACGSGEVCSAALCALQCAGGTTNCGGICVDMTVDPAHCGSCTNVCGSGEVCSAGQCGLQCVGGTTNCGGTCVNLNSDPAHCGGCTAPCGVDEACVVGSCEPLFHPKSCLEILNMSLSTGDGSYTIDPDGPGGAGSFDVFCDMTSAGGGWTQIAHVRRETGMPYPGKTFAGTNPNALGYSIDATNITFSEIAITHNGLPVNEQFASFTLTAPQVFDAAQQDIVYTQTNANFSILSLSAANSGGWGNIPLACINSTTANCLNTSRSIAHGAVATGGGNCQQIDTASGVTTGCGGWGTAPNAGNDAWDGDGGKIFLR